MEGVGLDAGGTREDWDGAGRRRWRGKKREGAQDPAPGAGETMVALNAGFTLFHTISKMLEITLLRFSMVKRFHSLSSPFHAKILFLLSCHSIKCA